MKFEKTNPNPKKLTGDCVIRAISLALGQDWETTYKDLCELGYNNYLMPNDKKNFAEYLKSKNCTKMAMPKKPNGRKYKVSEFADKFTTDDETFKNNNGYIVQICNHLTYIKQGTLYDTWNCGNKCVLNYWVV